MIAHVFFVFQKNFPKKGLKSMEKKEALKKLTVDFERWF
jgi:hypothetical protein